MLMSKVRGPTRDTLQTKNERSKQKKMRCKQKGFVANKKRTLQTISERCKQKRCAANKKGTASNKKDWCAANKKGNHCKQKREPLQTKKQTPQREEELLNAGVRCSKKTTHIMRCMVLSSCYDPAKIRYFLFKFEFAFDL